MEKELKKAILDVPDFPKKGIIFKDLTPVFKDKKVFKKLIDTLGKRYKSKKITAVVCVEARGFLLGAPLAYKLGAALVPVRKPGKLPGQTFKQEYALEYGTDALEIHRDAVGKGDRVLILDDVLATGGTAGAVTKLVEKCGAKVTELAFVIELDSLKGREKVKPHKVFSMVHY
ncbi:MAG: adenine phosphoribosyltransferase [Spirochaetia bacterium]|nr:adenine phosphoribosyltransferase [Spirochaetia bacterium]